MVLHRRVAGGEEHTLMAVLPADKVGRRTVLAVDFDDLAVAVLITLVTPPDRHPISRLCLHDCPPCGVHEILVVWPVAGCQGSKAPNRYRPCIRRRDMPSGGSCDHPNRFPGLAAGGRTRAAWWHRRLVPSRVVPIHGPPVT